MQVLSLTGAALILAAFVGSSYNKLNKDGLAYALMNCIGAALLAVTLINPLNLGALILETVWSITGLMLVFRALKA